MKKMIIAIASAVIVSTTVMAQDKSEQKEYKQVDKTEMVKHRTERMVKDYGLNATQQQQLQALNEKYADKIGPRRHHGRPHGPRPDSLQHKDFKKGELKKGERMERRERPDKGQSEAMQAYESELQQIMTPEQFSAYKADMEQRFKKGRRGPKDE